ncbi:spermatogenesis-associated protein 45-like [Thalassophryne amazonica]|uniref:spermatogenesis-associated protein 45-like n=1 Tax=Thalassophryne amazonica TaxID=390379 RepID=UPI00147163AC|nr:spermatogenesis-associated protein 45-like [Thalassophryne amazonica]
MPGCEERHLAELNLHRESWCQVEVKPRQSWDRTQRRHFRSHLQTSPVLLSMLTSGPHHRLVGMKPPPPPAKLPERRHFEESYTTCLI